MIIVIITVINSPFQRNKIQTLLLKLSDELIWLKLVENLQTLSSSTNQ